MALALSTLYRQTAGIVGIVIYTTADTVLTATGAGYFNGAYNDLNVNDVVIILASDGTRIQRVSAVDRTAKTVTMQALAV